MPKQPPQFLRIINQPRAELKGVDAVASMAADFGPQARNERLFVADLKALIERFKPSVEIDGKPRYFSADELPLPKTVARWLLEKNAKYRALQRARGWIQNASVQQLRAVAEAAQGQPSSRRQLTKQSPSTTNPSQKGASS